MIGYIKLYRQLFENPDYFAEKFSRIQAWIDLLLLANYEESAMYVRGIKLQVGRGQLAKSMDSLAERWRWPRYKVEQFLKELENQQQINVQKNNVISLITIVNYERYQGIDTENDGTFQQQINVQNKNFQQQIDGQNICSNTLISTNNAKDCQNNNNLKTDTFQQQINGQKEKQETNKDEKVSPTPLPKEEINKEEKDEKAKKIFFGERKPTRPPVTHPIEERKQWLVDSIKKADNGIPRDMLNDFYLYWTETTPGGLKMRFELEKTWVTSMRLARWYKNNRK